uniref:Uncharacterized protein n=1 Tax=Knipowitschia caucasica TaxID=637954 RepID=A0AAV2KLB3_KNICA
MVSNIFMAHLEFIGQQKGHKRKSSTVTRKYQAATVSSKFQQSLLELVEKMERFKSLVGVHQIPAASGENCVEMLRKLCPLHPGIFLKEDIYQLLECKRERSRHLAALTLQRYTRMFFVRKRYKEFRKKMIRLQAQCRGYLARFVSDHAPAGYQAMLQHRLIQGGHKTQLSCGDGTETARTYPLALLEWTANRKKANLALHLHCFDGGSFLCPVHSWTSGEDLAGNILRHRGVSDWCKGSSILMKEHGQRVELAGHDYVMDMIADLELPSHFPKQKSYFIISSDDPTKVRANAGLAMVGSGFDSDDETSPFSAQGGSRPACSLPDSDGYYSHVVQ